MRGKTQVTIRLCNGGFTYDQDLPYLEKSIFRHRHKNWNRVRDSKMFIQRYMNIIDKFLGAVLGSDYDTEMYLNREYKRCDIETYKKSGEFFYEIARISFEPGGPSKNAIL